MTRSAPHSTAAESARRPTAGTRHHLTTPALYGPDGYTHDGWDSDGRGRQGYDRDGVNADGWNRNGTHTDTGTRYGPDGYNLAGYDADGYDRTGHDRSGWTRDGTHRDTGDDYGPADRNGIRWTRPQKAYDLPGLEEMSTGKVGFELGRDANGRTVVGYSFGAWHDYSGYEDGGEGEVNVYPAEQADEWTVEAIYYDRGGFSGCAQTTVKASNDTIQSVGAQAASGLWDKLDVEFDPDNL